ncbi:MAG: MaoC family dehydratase [Alphaproteobacteria bacterium]|jgi:acyl dehydratase|nr:MaoC family dehydratase [Alphaproteobacteria bacterium]MDP6567801.1 MaoC family dehydratase [Alphaproteobacteria bacterium]MDP6813856.1 MaoC family dehydratase [Alphaproteobacteria bacterium]
MPETLAYQDIDVGWQFPGPKVAVSREMIKEFAAASFDHNPLHWDDDYLAETTFAGHKKFDDVIAHGLMTYAIMTRAMTDWLWPDVGEHRRLETRFRQPVYPGDEIEVRGQVVDKRETKQGRWLVCALTVTNQRGETVATGDALAELLA